MRTVKWLVPLGLYALALVLRLLAAWELPFPTTEPSAYYVGVAHNLLAGEGLVSGGVWSYATPPLAVPKPAFEPRLPMSRFVLLVGTGGGRPAGRGRGTAGVGGGS